MDLALQMAARGHRVHLFARRRPFGMAAESEGLRFWGLEEPGDGPWDRLDDRWSDRDLEELVSQIVAVATGDGLDVLHVHYAVPFAEVACRVRRRLGARSPALVGTLHGTDVSIHAVARRRGARLRKHVTALDALTTVSRAHAGLARDLLRLAAEPVVIPNFVDLARFQPLADPPASDRRPRIVHVSNYRPVKDPQTVARVFAGVRKQLDADLWLVGDGAEMPATLRLLRKAGVQRDVRLFGLRQDVEHILPLADLMLITSHHESFSLAALEAAACGLPVLATRVGGLPELVHVGVTGLLFEPGDVEEAVRAACRLLRDPVLRAAMGRAGLERAGLHSAERVVPAYESLYHELLDSCAAPALAGPARASNLEATA